MCKILIAESSDFYAQYEIELIHSEYKDAEIIEVSSKELLKKILKEQPNAVLVDNRLLENRISGESSAGTLKKIKEISPSTKVIVVSSERRGLSKLKRAGTIILEKPILATQFLAIIGQVYINSMPMQQ